MAGYLLFFPDQHGTATAYMHQVGLGSLLADGSPMFTEAHQGPDGRPGAVCWWDNPLRPESTPSQGYCPKTQDWEPCKPCGELAAGRFWLGRERERLPGPRDLERRRMLDGIPVQLEDGNEWIAPVAKRVPVIFGMDDAGKLAVHPKRQFFAFHSAAMKAREEWVLTENSTVPYLDGMRFAVDCLSQNYRLNWDIVSWLGLLGDDSMCDVILAVCTGTIPKR